MASCQTVVKHGQVGTNKMEGGLFVVLYCTVVSLMRPQRVTSKMVSQKGFALFGGLSGSDTTGFSS